MTSGTKPTYRPWGIFLGLVAIFLLWRGLTLQPIEWGDPLGHWRRTKMFWAGFAPLSFTHQDARFALYLPIYLVHFLFGDHPTLYYLFPVAVNLILLTLVFHVTRTTLGLRQAVAATIMAIFFPQLIRGGSQILPGIYESAAVMAVMYFLLAPPKKLSSNTAVGLAGVCLFIGYLSKIQVAFYGPGLALALWLHSKKLSRAIWFCAGYGILLVGETLLYLSTSSTPLSRINTLFPKTLNVNQYIQQHIPADFGFINLFDRYLELPSYWLGLFIITTFAPIFLWKRLKPVVKIVYIAMISFLLIMTFGLRSIDPVVPIVHFEQRFLTGVIPLQLIILVGLVGNNLIAQTATVAGAMFLFLNSVTFATPHPITQLRELHDELQTALATDQPILFTYDIEKDLSDEELRRDLKRASKWFLYKVTFHFPFDNSIDILPLLSKRKIMYLVKRDFKIEDIEAGSILSQNYDTTGKKPLKPEIERALRRATKRGVSTSNIENVVSGEYTRLHEAFLRK